MKKLIFGIILFITMILSSFACVIPQNDDYYTTDTILCNGEYIIENLQIENATLFLNDTILITNNYTSAINVLDNPNSEVKCLGNSQILGSKLNATNGILLQGDFKSVQGCYINNQSGGVLGVNFVNSSGYITLMEFGSDVYTALGLRQSNIEVSFVDSQSEFIIRGDNNLIHDNTNSIGAFFIDGGNHNVYDNTFNYLELDNSKDNEIYYNNILIINTKGKGNHIFNNSVDTLAFNNAKSGLIEYNTISSGLYIAPTNETIIDMIIKDNTFAFDTYINIANGTCTISGCKIYSHTFNTMEITDDSDYVTYGVDYCFNGVGNGGVFTYLGNNPTELGTCEVVIPPVQDNIGNLARNILSFFVFLFLSVIILAYLKTFQDFNDGKFMEVAVKLISSILFAYILSILINIVIG